MIFKGRLLFTGRMSLLIAILCVTQEIHSQSIPPDSINKKRLNTLVVGTAAAYTASMIVLSEVWYSDFDQQPFTFFNDSREWYQVDKVGHFYSTYQLSYFGSMALQWTGMNKRKSDKIASLTSFLMISSIEIFDGKSSGYGASGADILANAVGSSFYLGQQLLWNQSRIHPKFSFHTTSLADVRPDVLGSTLAEQIIKDYNGQTYWLSFDMNKFFRFPHWLNFAVGYGAENMVYANEQDNIDNGYDPYRQYYLSIDFDLSEIKTKSKAVKTLLYIVNMIKLPSPAIEFSKNGIKTYAFYF